MTTLSTRNSLIDQLDKQTMVMSSVNLMLRRPAAQELLVMGDKAVPQLLGALRDRKAVIASMALLRQITGQSPVTLEDQGRVSKMIRAWLDWGEKNGRMGQ